MKRYSWQELLEMKVGEVPGGGYAVFLGEDKVNGGFESRNAANRFIETMRSLGMFGYVSKQDFVSHIKSVSGEWLKGLAEPKEESVPDKDESEFDQKLMDELAKAALPGVAAWRCAPGAMAELAYEIADAMMKERALWIDGRKS